jgi:hypothetical protein
MVLTQLSAAIIALGVTLAVLVWRRRARRLNGENPEGKYRRDIQTLRRGHRVRGTGRRSEDVWSAGAASEPAHSKAKKAATWVALGSVGSCGGCGGCGCGG